MENKPQLIEFRSEHWYRVDEVKVVEGAVGETITHYIPSVTTKLGVKEKSFLAKWRGDIGNREADMRLFEAQQKGIRIHSAVEKMLRGGSVIYNPWNHPVYSQEQIAEMQEEGPLAIVQHQDEMLDVWKVKQQLDILKPKVMDVEMMVYDLENKDAGTIDHVYEVQEGIYAINGRTEIHLDAGIYIGDLKTGQSVTDDVWLQVAPYLVMYEKMTGNQVAGAIVTHTGSKTKTGIPGLSTLVRSRQVLIESDYPDYRRASDLWMRDHKNDKPETYKIPSILKLQGEQNGVQ